MARLTSPLPPPPPPRGIQTVKPNIITTGQGATASTLIYSDNVSLIRTVRVRYFAVR